MNSLPLKAFSFVQISYADGEQNHLTKEILSKRLTLGSPSNVASYIYNLETYLNFIYSEILGSGDVNDYLDVLEYAKKIVITEGSIPWNLPVSRKVKEKVTWSLNHELIIIIVNIILSYREKGFSIIQEVLSNDLLPEKESQQLWLNSFKLFKSGLEYLNFLKTNHFSQLNSDFFEASPEFIKFIDLLLQSSIQLTFLSKSVWTLKAVEFDIGANDSINYSTLARISIYVRDQLKNMLNILKSHNISVWAPFIESLSRLNVAYISTLSSIENYKQDHIGRSIGFINSAIENITTNTHNDQSTDGDEFEDKSKLKKKFSVLKKKLGNSTNKVSIKTKKIRINKEVYENLKNEALKLSLQNLFQLVNVLNLKYNLENNNLKFDIVVDANELFQNFLPTGRPVPISDTANSWIPNIVKRSVQNQASQTHTQSQYF